MLVRLFKANHFYNILLAPLLGALLLIRSLQDKAVFNGENCNFISTFCNFLVGQQISNSSLVLINYGAILVIGFLLLYINAKYSFIKERTFLPPYFFLFIVLAFPTLHILQPIFFAAIFILLALNSLFGAYDKRDAVTNSFNAGFLTGVAAIFYLPALLLAFLVPISLSTIRGKSTGKEFFVSIVGVFMVWLFYFAYFFMIDKVEIFIELFNQAIIFSDRSLFIKPPTIVFLSVLGFLTILASFFIIRQYDSRKISTRRYFKVLAFYFFGSLALFAIPSVSIELLILVSLPLTYLLANYLTLMKRRFWSNFIMFLLIALAIGLQLLLK